MNSPSSDVFLINAFVEGLRKELKPANFPEGIHAASPQDLALLYRKSIEALNRQVCESEHHLPMTRKDVLMMCRAMLSCSTLAEAIQCSIDFCSIIHPRGGEWSLTAEGEWAVFTQRALRKQQSSASCFLQTIGLLSTLWLFEWLIGEKLHPRQVVIGLPGREAVEPLLGLFEAPILLSQSDYGFEFSSRLLERPLIRQGRDIEQCLDPMSFRLIGFVSSAPPLHHQIRLCLKNAMLGRKPLPNLDEIATALGTSTTTLRRRLREDGSSFKMVRDEFLRDSAGRYLQETSLSIERISEQLGFSNNGAFRRAFLRWYGCSPSKFRKSSPSSRH